MKLEANFHEIENEVSSEYSRDLFLNVFSLYLSLLSRYYLSVFLAVPNLKSIVCNCDTGCQYRIHRMSLHDKKDSSTGRFGAQYRIGIPVNSYQVLLK